MKQQVEIPSYQSFWNFESRIYKLGNFVLPVSVNPFDLLYFLAVLGVVFLFRNALSFVPTLFKYGFIPYVITMYLRKMKLDGKNPLVFFRDYIIFILRHKRQYQFLQEIRRDLQAEALKINWVIGCRCWR